MDISHQLSKSSHGPKIGAEDRHRQVEKEVPNLKSRTIELVDGPNVPRRVDPLDREPCTWEQTSKKDTPWIYHRFFESSRKEPSLPVHLHSAPDGHMVERGFDDIQEPLTLKDADTSIKQAIERDNHVRNLILLAFTFIPLSLLTSFLGARLGLLDSSILTYLGITSICSVLLVSGLIRWQKIPLLYEMFGKFSNASCGNEDLRRTDAYWQRARRPELPQRRATDPYIDTNSQLYLREADKAMELDHCRDISSSSEVSVDAGIESSLSFDRSDQSSCPRQHPSRNHRPCVGSSCSEKSSSGTGGLSEGRDVRDDLCYNEDDEDDGEVARNRKRQRGSDPGDSNVKRYPCPYQSGALVKFGSHTTCYVYISQLLRHLESEHDYFICSKCLTTFGGKEQKDYHKRMSACILICTNRACKRHRALDSFATSEKCKCLFNSDDKWAAIFRQIFPQATLPAPWPSRVQPWLLETVEHCAQVDTSSMTSGSSGPRLLSTCPSGCPWNQETVFSQEPFQSYTTTLDVPMQGSGYAQIAPDLGQNMDQGDNPDPQLWQNGINVIMANESHRGELRTTESDLNADMQRVLQKPAILEQRVQQPSRSEKSQNIMLRLAYKRLVEIGDSSVQQGGILRETATLLTPDILEDEGVDNNPIGSPQLINMTGVTDWNAAGLGPQHLVNGGKGKQRAAPEAADSAYHSIVPMD